MHLCNLKQFHKTTISYLICVMCSDQLQSFVNKDNVISNPLTNIHKWLIAYRNPGLENTVLSSAFPSGSLRHCRVLLKWVNYSSYFLIYLLCDVSSFPVYLSNYYCPQSLQSELCGAGACLVCLFTTSIAPR